MDDLRILEATRWAGFNQDVGATPFVEIAHAGSMKLLRFSTDSGGGRPPLLIVPSLINRYYILDLLPEKSLIAYLVQYYEVYLLEWGEARDEDKEISLEKIFEIHFDFLFHEMLYDAGADAAHVVGHCLGGNLALIWSLLHPDQVTSLSLLTTPLDFSVPGKLQGWARHRIFDVGSLVGAYGNAPWPLLQAAFLSLKPSQVTSKWRRIFAKCGDGKAMRSFLALESWSADNRNIRGACYQDLIELFYRQNCFLTSGFPFKGKRYWLKDLRCPVSAISASDDHIVPLQSTLTRTMLPSSGAVRVWHCEGGHIGALLSQQTQKQIWPAFVSWLHEQEEFHEPPSPIVAI